MKNGVLYICCLLIVCSCCTKSGLNHKKLIEINVAHEESTGSLDAVITNYTFNYPDDIKKVLRDTTYKNILLEGNNPYSSKGSFWAIFSSNKLTNEYKLSGYFSRVDSIEKSEIGKAAVFYVVKFEKIKK